MSTLARIFGCKAFRTKRWPLPSVRSNGRAHRSIMRSLSATSLLRRRFRLHSLLAISLRRSAWLGQCSMSSAKYTLNVWHARGLCLEGALFIACGDLGGGLRRLQSKLDEIRETRSALYYLGCMAVLAEGLGHAGQPALGIKLIDDGIARSERIGECWCIAELLRVKGVLVLLENRPDASRFAQEQFELALKWARSQGVLSLELRATTSLARLWRQRGYHERARELLAPICGRFTEGFATADFRAAKALIDGLA